MEKQRTFIAIDLKSFYASVECVERGLDPLLTNLVVADASRTEKTICLAVTPSLKAYGISGRARLFEVVEKVRQVNMERLCFSPEGIFTGRSTHDPDVQANDGWELDYIVAPPRMRLYMQYSARIYGIYLRYIAPEDIHVYSVDEVFIDATDYLQSYRMTPRELTVKLIHEVLRETGITATAGIGTNFYLSKVAMDIVAKHIPADKDGVRIAEVDEMSYRRLLWDHRPLTDFWRVGRGISRKLEANGMMTMGDVARRSLTNEMQLFKLFGVNAELLIDHAWGYEPVGMKDVKAYKPSTKSFSSGQVLAEPYTFDKARVVVREMADSMALKLVDKGLVTSHVGLSVNYDVESLSQERNYDGEVATDWYGRKVPRFAHGAVALEPTSSSRAITKAILGIYDDNVDRKLLVRRLTVVVGSLVARDSVKQAKEVQLDLFADHEAEERRQKERKAKAERENRMQKAALTIQKRFGKNAILRGTDFEDGATLRDRNSQVGGHKG
ncbi:MAG: DNA methylase [Bacteroidales bacterium]|nr:DNA methylase [Bacteroidales bacterium]